MDDAVGEFEMRRIFLHIAIIPVDKLANFIETSLPG
jgi:hypothetical protein